MNRLAILGAGQIGQNYVSAFIASGLEYELDWFSNKTVRNLSTYKSLPLVSNDFNPHSYDKIILAVPITLFDHYLKV